MNSGKLAQAILGLATPPVLEETSKRLVKFGAVLDIPATKEDGAIAEIEEKLKGSLSEAARELLTDQLKFLKSIPVSDRTRV